MTNIANKHQGARLQAAIAAIGRGEGNVVCKLARDGASALLEAFLQCAIHKPAPVAIGKNLVLGIDTGHRILAVHDARQG